MTSSHFLNLPETATIPLDASTGWSSVWRAAAWMEEGLSLDGLEALAHSLGTTEQELTEQWEQEFGFSPATFLRACRFRFARQLLQETNLSVSVIARLTRWNSEAEFIRDFQEDYGINPQALRPIREIIPSQVIRLTLSYQKPYDFHALLAFLRSRTIPGVEEVTEVEYRRTLRIIEGTEAYQGWFSISERAESDRLELLISPDLLPVLPRVRAIVARLFDLGVNPEIIHSALASLRTIHPGLRVPGGSDPLETAVRAVLGQQITVAAARTLAGRVAENLGSGIETPYPALTRLFPNAETLAAATQDQLGQLGILRTRISAIHSLAQWQLQDPFALTPWLEPQRAVKNMKTFPGIGDWTAHYIAMRVLKWADAFPAADYGVLHSLGLKKATEARASAESWRPWRSYGVMQLWHRLSNS